MNVPFAEQYHGFDPDDREMLFDRLVDGELSVEEYRQTLAALDRQPGDWRRLAIAFLEAQALGEELRGLVDASSRPVACANRGTAVVDRGGSRQWSLFFALAASLLLAFGLGWFAGEMRPFSPPPLRPQVAAPTTDADRPGVRSNAAPAGIARAPAPRSPLGRMTLSVSDETGRAQEFDLPVYAWDDDVARAWSEATLPEDLVEAARRSGHRLTAERQLVPLLLDDGRQVLFPVEQYQFSPISWEGYQ